jgi:hypothetical protein
MNKGKLGPIDVLCIYRVKKGKESDFKQMLSQHGPALYKAGLTPEGAPKIWKSETRENKTVFVEMMQWKDESSSHAAHQMPEVMAVWEPMGSLCEGMEFLHLKSVDFETP